MLHKGDLIFQSGSDCGARIIKWWTHSPYSHVSMYIGSGFIIHSVFPTGTVIVHYQTWIEYYAKGDQLDIYRPVSDITDKVDDVIDWSVLHSGRPYDIKGTLGVALPWLRQNGNTYFCSEFVTEAWKQNGVELVPSKPTYKVDPGTLSKSKFLERIAVMDTTKLTHVLRRFKR